MCLVCGFVLIVVGGIGPHCGWYIYVELTRQLSAVCVCSFPFVYFSHNVRVSTVHVSTVCVSKVRVYTSMFSCAR